MDWVKKNLFYVAGGAICLILLGGSGWYYYTKSSELEAINQAFDSANQEYQKYLKEQGADGGAEDPVVAVKAAEAKISGTIEEAKKYLTTGLVLKPNTLDDQEFKRVLYATVTDLQSKAAKAGVATPPDYQFSFTGQKKPLQYSTNSVDVWRVQLEDVKQLAEILIEAKVNKIEAVRRVPIQGSEDTKLGLLNDSLYGVNPTTNAFAVNQPYEIAFRAFSSELATVLDLLQRSPNFYIVKSIFVEPSHDVMGNFVEEAQIAAENARAAAAAAAAAAKRDNPNLPEPPKIEKSAAQQFAERYGPQISTPGAPRSVTTLPPRVSKSAQPGNTNNLVTVLYERPLHIALLIDLIKLKPTPGK